MKRHIQDLKVHAVEQGSPKPTELTLIEPVDEWADPLPRIVGCPRCDRTAPNKGSVWNEEVADMLGVLSTRGALLLEGVEGVAVLACAAKRSCRSGLA